MFGKQRLLIAIGVTVALMLPTTLYAQPTEVIFT